MHGVCSEPLDFNVMVEEHLTIEAVVMPDLEDRWILEVVFEEEDEITILGEVVNEQSGPIAEVDFRSTEATAANNFPVLIRRFILEIEITGLCVPSMRSELIILILPVLVLI
jgi:hypothetical protein